MKKHTVIRNKHSAPIDGVAPGAEGTIEGIGPSHHAVAYYAASGMVDVLGGSEGDEAPTPAASGESAASDAAAPKGGKK